MHPAAPPLPNADPVSPAEAICAWPPDRPLVALCSAFASADPADPARWSLLAAPSHIERIPLSDPDPLARLQHLLDSTADPAAPPLSSGWAIALSYELGARLEPRVHAPRTDPDWPLAIVACRCDSASTHTYAHHHARWNARPPAASAPSQSSRSFHLAPPTTANSALDYQRAVARAVEYIRAGDVFQVNLAHALSTTFSGSSRAAFAKLLDLAQPRFGGYFELDDAPHRSAALSASPELFLSFDPRTRRVTTRPIKGTRPAALDPADLQHSEKDRAELTMIVDLMRNDLGRVASRASVRVDDPRSLELHAAAGVRHAAATISATLAEGRSLTDLLRASFPGGSITGAPKVRAMQIINELESSPRGLYTGSLGFVADSGHACFNIAIRTALIRGVASRESPHDLDAFAHARATYRAGAGIVADSVPESEWLETLDKSAIFFNLARSSSP